MRLRFVASLVVAWYDVRMLTWFRTHGFVLGVLAAVGIGLWLPTLVRTVLGGAITTLWIPSIMLDLRDLSAVLCVDRHPAHGYAW